MYRIHLRMEENGKISWIDVRHHYLLRVVIGEATIEHGIEHSAPSGQDVLVSWNSSLRFLSNVYV